MSINTTYRTIPVNELKPDNSQPRKKFDEDRLEELAQSIKTTGVINPIEIDENKIIITGERRWQAAKVAGLKEVPCKIISGIDIRERFKRQLAENINRQELTRWEIGKALEELGREYEINLTPGGTFKGGRGNEGGISGLAKELGLSRTFVSEHLDIVRQPEPIQKMVRERKLSRTTLRIINKVPKEYKEQIAEKVVEEKLSDSALGVIIKAAQRRPEATDKILETNYESMNPVEISNATRRLAPDTSDYREHEKKTIKKIQEYVLEINKWLEINPLRKISRPGNWLLKSLLNELSDNIKRWFAGDENIKELKPLTMDGKPIVEGEIIEEDNPQHRLFAK